MKTLNTLFFILFLISNVFGEILQNNQAKREQIKFIYVHGFGERRFPPAFETKMRDFLKSLPIKSKIQTYRWNSQKLNLLKVIHQWKVANENADKEAQVFAKNILNSLEKEKTKYYLIGYSLGAKVISESFKYCNKLQYLRGVYFLGAALPKDYKVNTEYLPKGMKIINYYSKHLDHALKIGFYNTEKIQAGGAVGFLEKATFRNFRTVCTHVYKGGLIKRDYSNLVQAIGYLSLFNESIFIKRDDPWFNIEASVAPGILHWNDIFKYHHNSENLLIQQNANTNLFRAVSINKNGKRVRKAWGRNLHSILQQLNLFTNPSQIIRVINK